MYFVLSKLLIFLITPILWVFVLLLIALITKNSKLKRRLLITAVALLFLFSNSILLTLYTRLWDVSVYPPVKRHYSCAIVLGGFSSYNNKGEGFFNSSADRFIQGVKLVTSGRVSRILITGGNGGLIPGKFREADWVRGQLQQLKVPDSSILIEDRSKNTIENAVFSKAVLQKAHLQPPYLLVTSAFHMRRALMIFKKEGFNVDAYPCNYNDDTQTISISDMIPDAWTLSGWNTYLKEVVGYVVDRYKKY